MSLYEQIRKPMSARASGFGPWPGDSGSTGATSARRSPPRCRRVKRLADFDVAMTPGVNAAVIATLAGGAYLAAGEPVVLLGDSGTGKSHLLIGLGLAACEQGRRVCYATCAQLVNELAEAADECRLSRIVARYTRLDLLGPNQVRTTRPSGARSGEHAQPHTVGDGWDSSPAPVSAVRAPRSLRQSYPFGSSLGRGANELGVVSQASISKSNSRKPNDPRGAGALRGSL